MQNRLFKLFLMVACMLLGIADAGVYAADATGAATEAAKAGAAAVNKAGGEATPGTNGVGTHLQHNANSGTTTDEARLANEDFIEDAIDREVVKMFGSTFPIDQICRHIPQVHKNSMRYGFWSVDEKPIKTTVTSNFNGSGKLVVENYKMFAATDTIKVPSVLGYVNKTKTRSKTDALTLYVEKVESDGLTVRVINDESEFLEDPTPLVHIKQGAAIYRLARAASEGDVQTKSSGAIPNKDMLCMQIFKAQVAETTIEQESQKEPNWTFEDQIQLAFRDLRKSIELAFLWGTKGYMYDSQTERYTYTCAGIIQQIVENGTMVKFTEDITNEGALLEKIVQPIFYGNSGSTTRYLFAGTDFVTMLAKIENVSKRMDANQVFKKFGVDWKAIQLMAWQLNLVQHPLLNEIGLSNCAIVLDLPYVQKNVFRSLSQDKLDLLKAGIWDGHAMVLTEISSIALKYPKTHAFIADARQYNPTEVTVG